ncbi:MAG: hypothetical protein WDA65_00220 [Christensenellales bacterium]
MDSVKTAAAHYAYTLGFDDIRIVSPDVPPCKAAFAKYAHIPKEALAVAVLFKAYAAAKTAPLGMMALSPYYATAHFAYKAAAAFASYLTSRGYFAQHTAALDAKAAALLSGGFIGDNGFYYHPALGSLVCIQTVLTNAFPPDTFSKSDAACLHCGKCAKECSGVGDLRRCVRYYSDSLIPEELRDGVYQLLGCEKCQTICPLNSRREQTPNVFSVKSLLEGLCKTELFGLAGKNMARPRRIISQAVLYAANTKYKPALENINIFSRGSGEILRSHAIWAYNKLNGKNGHD